MLLLNSAAMFAVIFTSPSFWLALVVLLLDAAVVGFRYPRKSTTEVRRDGIYIRFSPMFRQAIPLFQIGNHYARTYRPILEYGGWGFDMVGYGLRARPTTYR